MRVQTKCHRTIEEEKPIWDRNIGTGTVGELSIVVVVNSWFVGNCGDATS